MKKKIEKIFLLMAVVITAVLCLAFEAGALASSGKCGSNVSWKYNEVTGELVISGNGEIRDYNTTPVTSQLSERSPFYECDTINSIIIEEGVTKIGHCAFMYNVNLKSVTIPESMTSIGHQAFQGDTSLTDVIIPKAVEWIYFSAFEDCTSLKNVIIRSTEETFIGPNVFSGCTSLESISVKEAKKLCEEAFYNCTNLKDISLGCFPISKNAFLNTAYYNDASNWENGVLYIDKCLIKAKDGVSGIYNIKNGTEVIASDAFKGLTDLKRVTMPDSVKFICSNAFAECEKLAKVGLSKNLMTLGDYVFGNCVSLTGVDIHYGVREIGASAFKGCSSLLNIVIPDSVTSVGTYAFDGCESLQSVRLSQNMTVISKGMFFSCKSLKGIKLPEGITIINGSAFCNCKSLKSCNLPEGLTTIGESAFHNCESLLEVIMPDTVTKTGEWAFAYCKEMVRLEISDNLNKLEGFTFYHCAKIKYIKMPILLAYTNSDFTSVLYVEEMFMSVDKGQGGNSLKDYSPQYQSRKVLKKVTIEEGVKSIPQYLFSGCSKMETLTIPSGVEKIEHYAFQGCSSLKRLVIPESVKIIGTQSFGGCSGIEYLEVPVRVSIYQKEGSPLNDEGSFKGVSNVKELVLTKGEGERLCYFSDDYHLIPWHYSRKSLKKVTIKKGAGLFMSYYFLHCSNLEKVIFEPESSYLGSNSYSFYWCESLPEIALPEGCLSLSVVDFSFCKNLKKMYLPKSLRIIEDYTNKFKTIGLTDIYYAGTKEDWTHIEGIYYIPANVKIHFHEHSYTQEVLRKATCISTSKIKYICKCGYSYTEITGLGDHTYETLKVIKKATLTNNGKADVRCVDCYEEKTVTVCKPTTFTLSTTAYTYNGKVKTPGVTVKDSQGKALTKGTDYKVTYQSGRTLPGKYSVRIDFIGKYEGTKRLYLTVAPSVPVLSKIARTTDAVRLTWSKVTDATGYRVYKYNSAKKTWDTVKTVTGTSYRVEKLKAGTTYKFKVKAYKKDGSIIWGKATGEIIAATNPATPKITSTSKAVDAVRLNWGKITGANGYAVYQYVGGTWKRIATITSNATVTYRVEKLKAGTSYKFLVKAYKKSNGETLWSSASPAVTVTTKAK